jgi:hypothetical protein
MIDGLRSVSTQEVKVEASGLETIRTKGPVKNTIHNLIQTLSVKTSSAARYGLYEEDARKDGMENCAELFARLPAQEREAIRELMNRLRDQPARQPG